jgi:hypothetical protein
VEATEAPILTSSATVPRVLSTSSIRLLETETCHNQLLLGLPHFLCAVTSSKSMRCATGEQLKNMHVPEICRMISHDYIQHPTHGRLAKSRLATIHQYAAVYNMHLRTPSRSASLVDPRKQVEFAIPSRQNLIYTWQASSGRLTPQIHGSRSIYTSIRLRYLRASRSDICKGQHVDWRQA